MKKVNLEKAVVASVKALAPANVLTVEDYIATIEPQIYTALTDYYRHVEKDAESYVNANYSGKFIHRLAVESYYSKSALREMLCKSPAWNEKLQCLVINGNRTHEPDKDFIKKLVTKILNPAMQSGDYRNFERIYQAARWFYEGGDIAEKFLLELAPKANLRQKKSKVFGALCKALGVWQDGGEFQKMFSDLCNEFNAKKIDFKLYVSINPAHFLTMSNPKNDKRGAAMVSCHSLNSDYDYRFGNVGYACDNVTMIAFTASDDKKPETLNNRKTNRQLFMYLPGNGLLLQSRLYTTCRNDEYGGVNGDEGSDTSKLYRELIQREISDCEQFPNFWQKPLKYCETAIEIPQHEDFLGYADWINFQSQAIVSLTKNDNHAHKGFTVGECSMDFYTGEKMYLHKCEKCGNGYSEYELYEVIDANGDRVFVCEDCLNENYFYCERCNEYHHNDDRAGDLDICVDCAENSSYYFRCEHCGEYHHIDDRAGDLDICVDCAENSGDYFRCGDCGKWHHIDYGYWVGDDYNGYHVCESCIGDYTYCENCECYHKCGEMHTVRDADGNEIEVCDYCFNEYFKECEKCGEWWHKDALENGLCPDCAAEKESENKKSA